PVGDEDPGECIECSRASGGGSSHACQHTRERVTIPTGRFSNWCRLPVPRPLQTRERHNVTSLPPQPSAHTPAEAPTLSRGTPPALGTARVPRQAGARRPWLALVVPMLPALLVSVDNPVLAFAVPQLPAPPQPTSPQPRCVGDVYPLILAALLVPMGSAADRFGRRRMRLIGGAGFATVAAAAAFSPNAGFLIVARAGMAVFGATLMPATLSLIRNIFTDAKQPRLAIAIWA